jgi:hypothetical protein
MEYIAGFIVLAIVIQWWDIKWVRKLKAEERLWYAERGMSVPRDKHAAADLILVLGIFGFSTALMVGLFLAYT